MPSPRNLRTIDLTPAPWPGQRPPGLPKQALHDLRSMMNCDYTSWLPPDVLQVAISVGKFPQYSRPNYTFIRQGFQTHLAQERFCRSEHKEARGWAGFLRMIAILQIGLYAEKILKGAKPPTCRLCSRPNSSWLSISRPRRPWASLCRPCCSPVHE